MDRSRKGDEGAVLVENVRGRNVTEESEQC